jgi:branched-chain amino acid transport system substrate-binding protein
MVRVRLSLAGVCAAAAMLGCGPERPAALEPVKVGVISSTSGPLATFGSVLQDAVVLASENVNAAGGVFGGRPLQLEIVDSESDAAIARARANDLVAAGVVAIVGPETSGQSEQVLEVATNGAVPMVSCCATSTSLSSNSAGRAGFFFRTAPSDALQGKALAYVARQGVRENGVDVDACPQAAFFSRGDSYGDGFKTVFDANYSNTLVNGELATIVASGEFAVDDPNVNDIQTAANAFASAIEANANPTKALCVVFITFGFEGGQLVKALDARLSTTSLNYHYLTGDGAQQASFLSEMQSESPALLAKVVGTVPFHAENAAYDEFAVAFEARHGTPPPALSAQAFDAMFITALAVAKANSTVGVDVRNALFSVSGGDGGSRFENGNFFGEIAGAILEGQDVDYVGPSGDLTFSDVGDVQGDYVIWQVASVDSTVRFVDKVPLPVSVFDP